MGRSPWQQWWKQPNRTQQKIVGELPPNPVNEFGAFFSCTTPFTFTLHSGWSREKGQGMEGPLEKVTASQDETESIESNGDE